MKKKLTAFILSLLMMCIAVAPEMIASAEEQDSGLRLNKTATVNGDGTYKITLEAYATGSTITSLVEKPTDIILVLDTSTSMECCIVCGKKNSSTHSYAEVVSIDEGKTYYIRSGSSSYTEVKYCSGTHESGSGATTQCAGGAGWYTGTDASSHTEANKITPKTAATPNGTQFYTGSGEKCTSRIDALKTAANGFVDAVYEKTKGADKSAGTDDDVDHRIAIIRFNSSAKRLTGSGDNESALLSVKNSQSTLKNAIMNQLDMNQGTVPASGITIANSIFESYTDTNRNRVMVVFTDGAPGAQEWTSSSSDTAANNAINAAYTTKNTHKATVYTIGIFAGADASGTIPDYVTNVRDDAGRVANCNRFMYLMSSQYPNAMNMSNTGTAGNKGYYLSAGTADALNEIFQKISQTTGGSTSTLNSNAVVKDIMSPYFTLPAGTTASNITIKTYKYNGNSYTAENAWTENSDTMGAAAEVVDGNVSVTGFDFSANWCGTESQTGTAGNVTYRGNKLVISFNVTPRPGFLGGSNVPTNGADSGVYENADAETAIENFVVPQVNVPLGSFEVAVQEKNVYLTNDLTQADMLTGATVTLKDWSGNPVAAFDYTKTGVGENYGLESWQNAFVDLSVTLPDDQTRLMTDSSYTLSASINRKGETDATPAVGTAVINVFKPELTFKDGTVDYKSVISNTGYKSDNTDKTYESDNFVSSETKWTHGEGDAKKTSTDEGVTMLGTAPELTRAYAPTGGVDTKNIVTSTTHVPVKATVAIKGEDVTSHTAFIHECDAVETGKCEWDTLTPAPAGGAPAFLLHVINVVGDLKITKTRLNQHTYATGDNESAIFTVTGENNETWTVAINGNGSVTLTGLQVGSYTVTELNDWTWRYADQNAQTAEVVGGNTAKVTFNNIHSNQKWLGGDNFAKNVFTGSSDVLAEPTEKVTEPTPDEEG